MSNVIWLFIFIFPWRVVSVCYCMYFIKLLFFNKFFSPPVGYYLEILTIKHNFFPNLMEFDSCNIKMNKYWKTKPSLYFNLHLILNFSWGGLGDTTHFNFWDLLCFVSYKSSRVDRARESRKTVCLGEETLISNHCCLAADNVKSKARGANPKKKTRPKSEVPGQKAQIYQIGVAAVPANCGATYQTSWMVDKNV